MLKKIFFAVLILVAAVLLYATTRPGTLHIERAADISATPAHIASFITDFHVWRDWSPWEKLDPTMKRTFSGSPNGTGAVYEWAGNSDVGSGRMEITGVTADRITLKLDFLTPFENHNTTTFTFVPSGTATHVVWAMDGPNPYLAKVMGIFVDMEKMIGGDFEKGLANLKSVAEK
jgi:hypothetical protein